MNPRQGPFIQELFIHPRATRRRLVDEAIDLGATAIATVPWEPFQQRGRTQPFVGRDLANVKDSHLQRIRQLVRWCDRKDVRVYLYGLMGPWARRGDVAGYRFQGREIPAEDWRAWRGDAREGFLRYLQRVARFVERLEADVRWVGGVEAFGGGLGEPGPPANRYEVDVREVLGDPLQHVAQGQWGVTLGKPETHVDPGQPDRSGHGGGLLATDGWGESREEWLMPDGRRLRFAALPAGNRRAVVAYVSDLYRDATAMRREALLMLHPTQWQTYALGGPTRPGIVAVDVDPFGAIYRRLRTLEQEYSIEPDPRIPLEEVEFLHGDGDGMRDWAETSRIASVRIDPEHTIEVRHSMGGRWPVQSDVEGNVWIVAWIDGRWRAWTWEWMRSAQALRHVPGPELGPRAELPSGHPLAAEVHGWRPQPGELVGFMASTHARGGERTANERSGIYSVEWPA